MPIEDFRTTKRDGGFIIHEYDPTSSKTPTMEEYLHELLRKSKPISKPEETNK